MASVPADHALGRELPDERAGRATPLCSARDHDPDGDRGRADAGAARAAGRAAARRGRDARPVIDLDRLEANLTDLQSYVDEHGIALWPHTKTHKSPEIGRRQLELGAAGLTVAKTGEAQVFQEAGAPRILVHYPPFGADKWERLADVAAAGVELTVAVDSVAPAEGLAATLAPPRRSRPTLLVEIDVGLHRTGQTTRRRRARARAGALEAPRASRSPASAATRATAAATSALPRSPRSRRVPARRRATRSRPRACRTDRISGGSTPTRATSLTRPVSTSCASGTYALLDRNDGGPTTRVRALGRGDRHLRRRPDQSSSTPARRRSPPTAIPTAATAPSSGCPAQTSRTSTRSMAMSTSRRSTTARRRQPPADRPESRVRLHEPPRRPARRPRRRRRSRDPRGSDAGCSLALGVGARTRRAGRRSTPCSPSLLHLRDPHVRDHREQQRRPCARQFVVLVDPVQERAERLPRAPLERLAGDERVISSSAVSMRGHSIDAGRSQRLRRSPSRARRPRAARRSRCRPSAPCSRRSTARRRRARPGASIVAPARSSRQSMIPAVAALQARVDLAFRGLNREAADQRPRRQASCARRSGRSRPRSGRSSAARLVVPPLRTDPRPAVRAVHARRRAS